VPLKGIGVRDHFGQVSKSPYLLKKFKMTADDIVEMAMVCLEVKNRLRS
jgi:transketolase C-terminal domain/subunit